MKEITYDKIRLIAKEGDILIGKFKPPFESNFVMPIILIGECVECDIEKDTVKENATKYLEKLQGDIYQEYKIVEKKYDEEEKTYKFKVGDKVRAINNEYVLTSTNFEWEGIVIFASDNEFSAKTTHSTKSDKGKVFYNLDYSCFEKVEA